eukprot:CAMPEP_0171874740 /NCGR_PEP_ID=MMETSP0992-20121227/35148_1 /TAXON_ID=483369 /ORGANISM="non described non described, Strain CCMP2098" /LENGTH=188 /DNA_ID=CAMNT_0012499591 /DNA_START=198 /DNA_END=765 /DNA_ORIENTATION=-
MSPGRRSLPERCVASAFSTQSSPSERRRSLSSFSVTVHPMLIDADAVRLELHRGDFRQGVESAFGNGVGADERSAPVCGDATDVYNGTLNALLPHRSRGVAGQQQRREHVDRHHALKGFRSGLVEGCPWKANPSAVHESVQFPFREQRAGLLDELAARAGITKLAGEVEDSAPWVLTAKLILEMLEMR